MRISVRVPEEVADRLDAVAAARGLSRSECVRSLLAAATAVLEPATFHEALGLLSEKARAGSVPAQVALIRALARDIGRDPLQRRRDELATRRRARAEAS